MPAPVLNKVKKVFLKILIGDVTIFSVGKFLDTWCGPYLDRSHRLVGTLE